MSSQQLSSILKGLSATEMQIIEQLLNAFQQQSVRPSPDSTMSLVDDYMTDDEEQSAPILKKKRGRPKLMKTEDEIAVMKAKIEAKEQRRIEREMNDAMKSDEAVSKKYRTQRRNEAALAKKAETEQKAIELKKKRTEIYGKMLAAAADYKAKWNL
jgi:hypothetical protein